MAGIGFELRKLFSNKSAAGYLRAYSYTAVVTVGPLVLVTLMILAIQSMLDYMNGVFSIRELFTLSIVYPFIFSQIVASGFSMLITRFLADKLYAEEYADIVPSLYGVLALALPTGCILAVWFLWQAPLAAVLKLAAFILFMELILIWVEGVYLSALKDYFKIVQAYACGAAVAVVSAYLVLKTGALDPALGVILAVDIGIFVTAVLLMLNINGFFGQLGGRNFLFLHYLETHFPLFLTNLLYTVSLYIPNFIFWQGPLAVWVENTYVYAPLYDVATFYAFLSTLPCMVLFVIVSELAFYDKYTAYFMLITAQGNYKEIADARQEMLQVMWSEVRNLLELQLVFALAFLAIGTFLLPRIGLSHSTLGIYNLLVLGALCNGLLLIIITLLLYLEDRTGALGSAGIFLLTNAGFNYLSLQLGESTYGFGFFLAAFLSLVGALWRLGYYTDRIDYYVFCSQPVFNNTKPGLLARVANRLYPERRVSGHD